MPEKDLTKKVFDLSTEYRPSLRVRRLHSILEFYHLTDFYKISGPEAIIPYLSNGFSPSKVVSKLNSYFLKEKMDLSAETAPEYKAIRLSPRSGPGLESIRELRLVYPELFDKGNKPIRNYCNQ